MKKSLKTFIFIFIGSLLITSCNSGDNSSTDTDSTVAVSSISLDKSSEVVLIGNTLQLTATINPSNASDKSVTWSSDNTNIVTVSSSGLVTAVDYGHANITVSTTDGGKTAVCQIIVPRKNTGVLDTSFDTDGIVTSNGGIGITPWAFGQKNLCRFIGKYICCRKSI